MALYRRPRSPYYWSKFTHEGRVVYFSTRERTKVEALRVEREEAARLKKEARLAGRYSLATLAAKLIASKEADGKSGETITMMWKHLELHILPFFGEETDVRTIDVKRLYEYKAARAAKVKPPTVSKELSTIRQILAHGEVVLEVIESAPDIRSPKLRFDPKWRYFTEVELAVLFSRLKTLSRGRGRDAYDYFRLMANTGMRGGEQGKLTWAMVDPVGNALHLPGSITKTRRPRTVPLNTCAQAALAALRERRRDAVGRIFTARKFYTTWRKALATAGLGYARPHDLRHTFGSMLHKAGRGGPEIRDIMGHVTLAMENHYAHTHQAQLHAAVACVELGNRSPMGTLAGDTAHHRRKVTGT